VFNGKMLSGLTRLPRRAVWRPHGVVFGILMMLTVPIAAHSEVFITDDANVQCIPPTGFWSWLAPSPCVLIPTYEIVRKDSTSTTVRITIENNSGRWYYVSLNKSGAGVSNSGLPDWFFLAPRSKNDSVFTAKFNNLDSISFIADSSANHPSVLGMFALDAVLRLVYGISLPSDSPDIIAIFQSLIYDNPLIDLGKALFVDHDREAAEGAVSDLLKNNFIKPQIDKFLKSPRIASAIAGNPRTSAGLNGTFTREIVRARCMSS